MSRSISYTPLRLKRPIVHGGPAVAGPASRSPSIPVCFPTWRDAILCVRRVLPQGPCFLLVAALNFVGVLPAWALNLGGNQDLDTALNTWQSLVGTDDSITYYPSGVYDWANKNGGNGVAMANLAMNGYKVYTDNGSSFKLDLNGGSITNGGDISTARAGASGNITVTNAGSISIGTLSTAIPGNNGGNSGSVTVNHTGSFSAASVTSQDYWGNAGAQSFAGDNSGGFTVAGNVNSDVTKGICDSSANGGNISIQGYTSVNAGNVITYTAEGTGGYVSIGTTGNPISGNILLGNILTSKNSSRSGGVNVWLYGNGSVRVGDVITGYYGFWGGGSIIVVNKGAFTAGTIQSQTSYGGGWQTVSFNGTDKSGAFTAVSISTKGRTGQDAGGRAASVTISNYSSVMVSNSIETALAAWQHTPDLAGNISITGISGDITIAGTVDLSAGSSAAEGILTLTTTGREITLGSLDLSKVRYAVVSPGFKCIVKGDLLGFSTNVTTQTQLRMPAGRKMIYYPGLPNNAYLAGDRYVLASVDGTPAAGGLLMPYASPGLVVTLK